MTTNRSNGNAVDSFEVTKDSRSFRCSSRPAKHLNTSPKTGGEPVSFQTGSQAAFHIHPSCLSPRPNVSMHVDLSSKGPTSRRKHRHPHAHCRGSRQKTTNRPCIEATACRKNDPSGLVSAMLIFSLVPVASPDAWSVPELVSYRVAGAGNALRRSTVIL